MNVFLRKKILCRDYKDVMLSTPTFNLNDFAKNIEYEVSLRQHMTPGHFKSVRGYFEKLRRIYEHRDEENVTQCLDTKTEEQIQESIDQECLDSKLEEPIQESPEQERDNPNVVEGIPDPLAVSLILDGPSDQGSDSDDSDEDPEERNLTQEEKIQFGKTLRKDIIRYFSYLKDVKDKENEAEKLMLLLGIYSARKQKKMKACFATRPRVSPILPTINP